MSIMTLVLGYYNMIFNCGKYKLKEIINNKLVIQKPGTRQLFNRIAEIDTNLLYFFLKYL